MTDWCKQRGKTLSYTQNQRTEHDLWVVGKREDRSGERASVVAQAVNAIIASRSEVFISPGASMWTIFVQGLMHRLDGHRMAKATASQSSRLLAEVHRLPTAYPPPSNHSAAKHGKRRASHA